MSDWTDETRARLEKRSRAMTVSSADAWDKQTGADIRAALGEIERLIELVNGSVGWRTAQEQRERAESAEAVLDIASREIDRLTKKAESAEAEVERLRGLLTKVVDFTVHLLGVYERRSPELAREIIGSVSDDAEFRAALRGGGE